MLTAPSAGCVQTVFAIPWSEGRRRERGSEIEMVDGFFELTSACALIG